MEEINFELFKARLAKLIEKEALKRGDFVLSSGKTSNYYLDGRIITLSPEGAYLVAGLVIKMLEGKKFSAIGGPTLGADPIVGAISCFSHQLGKPINTFIVRKVAKGHGMQRQIEGPVLAKGSKVVLVDDVATTGKALIEAKEALDKIGVQAEEALVIVDRHQGAAENLAVVGLKLRSIFDIGEFGLP